MDRVAVLIHLRAELNFHRLLEGQIAAFNADALSSRQADALSAAGLEATAS